MDSTMVVAVFGEKTGRRQVVNERIHSFTPFLIAQPPASARW